MDKVFYWLWLQKALGYHAKINTLMRYFGSAEKLYKAGEAEWRTCGLFGEELPAVKINSLKNTSLDDVKEVYDFCVRKGVSIITPEDKEYPANLLHIPDYPAVLYVKGDISFLNDGLAVAVVGTRKPSAYGTERAAEITKNLACENVHIISGGALGIDSVAHRSAIEAGGKTVLVLGCGHFGGYLPENRELRRDVSENGAVISEYPPLTKATIYTFPKRNRIISGLSKGVVIVEAGAKSGTLNTALHARNQGRDVFAVPGDVVSGMYTGSNRLITDGAGAVFTSDDVLNYYRDYIIFTKEKITGEEPFSRIDKNKEEKVFKRRNSSQIIEKKSDNNKKIQKITQESVSVNAFLVYNLLSGKDMSLDDIVRESGLLVRKVLTALTELEMTGAVSLMEGGRYTLN